MKKEIKEIYGYDKRRYDVTKNGHVMFKEDIVKELNILYKNLKLFRLKNNTLLKEMGKLYEKTTPNPFMSEEEYSVNSQKIKKEDNFMGKSSGDTNFENGSYNHLKDSQQDNQSSDILNSNEQNPAHFCDCGKYLGFRGFCSYECMSNHYNDEEITITTSGKERTGMSEYSKRILESKEQKICEKTNCRECNINNCGCRE